MNIGSYAMEDYLNLVRSFHGTAAPGLIIGGFMVNMAQRSLPQGKLYDAISETHTCLPDAIQLLTPCTIGNGWMKILGFGRYALCLYDKYTGEGVRVYLDPAKLELWPEIRDWFLKRKAKKEQDSVLLQQQLIEAGESILSMTKVKVDPHSLKRGGKGAIVICPACGEAFPARDGATCLACQGQSPYKG